MIYIQKDGATLLVGAREREKEQNMKLVERKAFVDTVRINWSADLKK